MLLVVAATAALALQILVSPAGDDARGGSGGAPVRSLARALELARGKLGMEIVLESGVHEVSETLRIGPEHRGLVVRAREVRGARLRGGVAIPPGAFRPLASSDPAAVAIPKEVQARVRVLDLARLGLGPIDAPAGRGFPCPRRPAPPELHVDGLPQIVARWPDEGYATTGAVAGGASSRPSFAVAGARAARWRGAEEPWAYGYWRWDWADESLPIVGIADDGGSVTLGGAHRYGVEPGRPYRVENALAELDRPGEYVLSRGAARLHWLPPEEAEARALELSTLAGPLLEIDGAEGVAIEGLRLGPSRGTGVRVRGGRGVEIRGCSIEQVGEVGIELLGGEGHRVQSCEIAGTGEGGVVVEGGDRAALRPGGHAVENCGIRDFSRRARTYRPAVRLDGVGHRVARNLLEDAPHAAILFQGNDHRIEGNVVRRVLRETGDGGAFYTGRDWTARGTVIRRNAFFECAGLGKWENAVYLDDMASGIAVEGNLFVACHWAALFGGGRDNRFANNVIVDCRLALHLDARMLGWGKSMEATMLDRLRAVPFANEPWRSRYPALARILEDGPAVPKGNVVERNLLVRSGAIDADLAREARAHLALRDNRAYDADPGFVDAARGDYRLRPGARPLADIPGFAPIPFEAIGRYADRWVRP